MNLVIYKDLRGYCVTSEYNYSAAVRNERAIIKCYDFENADEIIDYYSKYFNESRNHFTVIDK